MISPCLGVHPKQPGQPLVELELRGERKSFLDQEKKISHLERLIIEQQ